MTLLDLVGVLDPLSRIASMDVDRDASVEVLSATDEPWTASGARFAATRVRPPLDAFDVLVVAGGPETRKLEHDTRVIDWLRTFPENRITASVCTGALLLGAAGRLRGKRATTHHASLDQLPRLGATPVRERVVRDGQLFTAGGVTSALDLGLTLVMHIYGEAAGARIAARMEYPAAP
jgi:cyclohexyl-isocyanide hydratase